MNNNQTNFWLSVNAENFAPEVLPIVKSKLEQMDNSQMMYLQSASFKKPSTIFLIAFILGWERFLLDDIGLGVLKLITGYGCGIWWLVDIISAKKRAQKYNFEQFQKATAFIGGTGTQPMQSVASSNASTQTTTAQEFVLPENKSKKGNTKIIVIIVVALAILIGGGLIYRNWYSWFEPDSVNAMDMMNLINSQIGGMNNTTGNTLDDIFSESMKAKKGADEVKETEAYSQTEQRSSTATDNQTYSDNNLSYIYSERLLTEDDIRGMSKHELKLLRNEIFARHGRKFKTKEIQDYFLSKDWYQPLYDEVQLSKIEAQNVEFIKRYE